MRIDKKEYERLGRYLAGEITKKEKSEIEAKIKMDPEYEITVNRLKKVWGSKLTASSTYDVEAAWHQVSKEIDFVKTSKGKTASEKKPWQDRRTIMHKHPRTNWFIRVAAVFLIVGLTSLFTLLFVGESIEDTGDVKREIVTEKGQRSNIHLRDGSRITLNSDSKVIYAQDFGEDSRVVHIKGEAYFDIAHEERPFFVYTEEAVIQILGTEFNVRSFEGEDLTIAVTEGLVSVVFLNYVGEGDVLLEKGDMAKMPFNGVRSPIVTRGMDLIHYVGWLDYHFRFDDTPMSKVARELERSYGVDIEFAQPELSELTISVEFEGDSIYEVLRVISLVHGIEYKMDGRTVLLSR